MRRRHTREQVIRKLTEGENPSSTPQVARMVVLLQPVIAHDTGSAIHLTASALMGS